MLNAVVGSAGLGPTVATLGEGIDLALANKESLVVGGELVTTLAEATGAQILPVDSEHSALLPARTPGAAGHDRQARPDRVRRAVPRRTRAELKDVTLEQALAHPTWAMGGKITIDSATLMNKGLELIEAHHLFGVPYERIDVVVHPQSIVHSLDPAERRRVARAPGLPRHARADLLRAAPPRARRRARRPLDLAELGSLTFEPVDEDAFPACAWPARPAGRRHRAVRAQRRQRDRRPRVPRRRAWASWASPRSSRRRSSACPRAGPRLRVALRGRPRGPRAAAGPRRGARAMSWFLAFAGFAR